MLYEIKLTDKETLSLLALLDAYGDWTPRGTEGEILAAYREGRWPRLTEEQYGHCGMALAAAFDTIQHQLSTSVIQDIIEKHDEAAEEGEAR